MEHYNFIIEPLDINIIIVSTIEKELEYKNNHDKHHC